MGKKIMIVDDSAMMRSVIKNYISKDMSDISFIEAKNGNEAIELYKTENPNLIFMDIMMPEVNGISAAKEIKKLNKFAKIVMCTSIKEDAQEKEVQEIGVVGYIVKPFKREEVNEILKKIEF